ncbi:MAG: alpha/beta fold hydrolase [Alphaproteobacteria bacterium]
MDHVIFIPGLNCTDALFAPQRQALGPRTTTVVADHAQDDTIEAIARRLLEAAPPEFALCGLSMGGYVALEVMRLAPERVSHLALLDTRASPDTPEDADRRQRLIEHAEAGRLLNVHMVLWPRLVHPARVGDRQLEEIVKTMMADTGAQGFIRQQRAVLTRPDYRPSLPSIRCPTLIMVGEEDVITPPAMASEMAEAIPKAQLIEIQTCGHLSTLEQPDAVTTALEALLAA